MKCVGRQNNLSIDQARNHKPLSLDNLDTVLDLCLTQRTHDQRTTTSKQPFSIPKTGRSKRIRALKHRGYDAIDGRTYAGREAKRWRAAAIARKGGASCPLHLRFEIDAAMFDLWLMFELADAIARDARKRRAVLNKRAKALPKLHEQYRPLPAGLRGAVRRWRWTRP